MKTKSVFIVVLVLVSGVLACNFGQAAAPHLSEEGVSSQEKRLANTEVVNLSEETMPTFTVPNSSTSRLMPENLEYLGGFRLPEASGNSSWEYSGQGLTFYPFGDTAGPADGYPGSLFGFGHDQQMLVSEISIPEPVKSKNLDDLNTAVTLQSFNDITAGKFNIAEMQLPVADLEYLSPQSGQGKGKLHYAFGQHFQAFEPSHGWSNLDLSNPQTAGPWLVDSYTNYATGDILFEIPKDWANSYVSGQRMATSRFREGVWGGLGPTLFSYNPGDENSPLASGTVLTEVTPLLLYGVQEQNLPDIVTDQAHQMKDYLLADHWTGGAWLTVGEKSAVVFVGTKALGRSWYGFANGVTWEYDCAEKNPPTCPEVPDFPNENRGYWAENYQAQIIFYDPMDFAAVAAGKMQTWEPQPYATLVLDPNLLNPKLDMAESKRDIVMASAFDREHGLLYIIERLADGYKSVIHVWKINP